MGERKDKEKRKEKMEKEEEGMKEKYRKEREEERERMIRRKDGNRNKTEMNRLCVRSLGYISTYTFFFKKGGIMSYRFT